MKGDFTRDTFDPLHHFSRVLMQQGRVQLDADWNEQGAIVLRYLRGLAEDLIGPHGAPSKPDGSKGAGFAVVAGGKTFTVAPGHYYVGGILCENDALEAIRYEDQRDYPLFAAEKELTKDHSYLVYLDVWERHITWVDDGAIREVSLGGPDTATRAKVVWQVKVLPWPGGGTNYKNDYDAFLVELARATPRKRLPDTGQLKVKAKEAPAVAEPCLAQPDAKYRGVDNRLYRVEIHKGGEAWDKTVNSKTRLPEGNAAAAATFKWSRDNGFVIFPLRSLAGTTATLDSLGRDAYLSLHPDDWVEIVDDDIVLREEPGPLLQVEAVDALMLTATLRPPTDLPGLTWAEYSEEAAREKHALLRRWDHRFGDPRSGYPTLYQGALLVEERKWLLLEDGVQIWFESEPKPTYCADDYWLIPARTATGDVEWPGPVDAPEAVPPHGVEHRYAPLAKISVAAADGSVTVDANLRRLNSKLWT